MSIIKLKEPWCFLASEDNLTQRELEELQSHFVDDSNRGCNWGIDEYNGVNWDGSSDWHNESVYFSKDFCNNKTTVYTIEQLRDIIAEHLAKQPVDKLEDDVVYYAESKYDSFLFVNKKRWVNVTKKVSESDIVHWDKIERYTITKATPAQIAHYEACVKAGKYVEPESIIQFVVGKWYKYRGYYLKYKGKDKGGYWESSESIDKSGNFIIQHSLWGNNHDKQLLENLSEIQEFLPEGHPDLIVKPKSERYIATMKFFEQLREPERSEAIVNYTEKFSERVPENLFQALSYGFNMFKASQGYDYWDSIRTHIEDNTYFKEELLVFGKYKVGDIVVSLALKDMFKVSNESKEDLLVMEQGTYTDSSLIRPATHEEVEAYNQGIRNIADIKPKQDKRAVKFNSEEERRHILAHFNPADISMTGCSHGWICLDDGCWSHDWVCLESDKYTEVSFQDWCKEFNHPFDYKEAVHCTTQEEWNFVLSKFNPRNISKNYFKDGQHCINTISPNSQGCVGSLFYYEKQNFTILTFKQWCDKYNHFYEVVPEYVECIKSTSHHYKENKIYAWPDTITEQGKHNKPNVLEGCVWKFKPSTKEAYDKQQEKLKMEELLSEAKKRYFVGTKFNSPGSDAPFALNQEIIIANFTWNKLSKTVTVEKTTKNNEGIIYRNGMWAEIIKEEPWVAQVGDWVYVLEAGSAELKVGEIVKCSHYSNKSSQQFGIGRASWLGPKNYRKATQEEIDSVTKGSDYDIDTSKWTADNWYVEVTSQEEADAVIDAAAKMYGKPFRTDFTIDDRWKYVGFYNNEQYQLMPLWILEEFKAKPRPITDFIQKSGIIAEGFHKSWVEKQVDVIMAGEYVHKIQEASIQGVSNLEKVTSHQKTVSSIWEQVYSVFDKHTAKQNAKQDELVIYKPKQTRLVEPGAVSASVSTTNLIIKSNSKYL